MGNRSPEGCVTAKSVLRTDRDELVKRADLEEETVDNVLAVLRAEFEEEPEPEAPAAPAEEAPEALSEPEA